MDDREAGILEALRGIARDQLGVDAPVELAADLRGQLALDSIRALELVIAVEDHFRVVLPDDELAGVQRVADLVRLVARRLAPC
jgi:acyl carrier protein